MRVLRSLLPPGFWAIAPAAFLMLAPAHGAQLVLHWSLNDGTGVQAGDDGQDLLTPGADPAGSRHGSYTGFSHGEGAPLWHAGGGIGGSGYLHFDGDNSASGYAMRYLESGGDLTTGGYSISFWVRINVGGGDLGGTAAATVDYAGGGTPGSRYYGLAPYNDGAVYANHRYGNPADGAQVTAALSSVANGQWHHIAGVFTSNTSRTLYLDGVETGSNSVSRTLVNPDRFSIGVLDRRTTADFFRGDIDEVSFYAGALTPSEVFSLFAAGGGDTDGDGMPDIWEQSNGLNVNVNDAAADPDSDALTNLQEFQNLTNPNVADTDGDTLNDGAEVALTTNPRQPDTDGDGLTDGAEVSTHHTSPIEPDSDGDFFDDRYEVLEGSNPNDSGSVPAPQRLVLHWALNDGSGNTATDDSQDALTPGVDTLKNRHGQYVSFNHAAGAPQWVAAGGVNNSGYLHFDGDATALTGYAMRYFRSGDDLPTDGYTLSAWFRIHPATEIGGTMAGILDFPGGGTPGSRYYNLSSYTGDQSTMNHRSGNPGSAGEVRSIGNFDDGAWHHLVGVFESASSRSLYVDGVFMASNETFRNQFHPDRFSIGLLDRPTTADHFHGDLDEVSLYIGALNAASVQTLFLSGMADSDHDGMADSWEVSHGLSVGLNDGDADADGDGFSNFTEFKSGTHPGNQSDFLALNVTPIGNDVQLTFEPRNGRRYALQRSLNLTNWTEIATFPAGPTAGVHTFVDPAPGPRASYRLKVDYP